MYDYYDYSHEAASDNYHQVLSDALLEKPLIRTVKKNGETLEVRQVENYVVTEPTFDEFKENDCDFDPIDGTHFTDEFTIQYKGEEYIICEGYDLENVAIGLVETHDLSYEKMLEVLFSVFDKEEFLKSGKTLESLEHKEYYK